MEDGQNSVENKITNDIYSFFSTLLPRFFSFQILSRVCLLESNCVSEYDLFIHMIHMIHMYIAYTRTHTHAYINNITIFVPLEIACMYNKYYGRVTNIHNAHIHLYSLLRRQYYCEKSITAIDMY